MDWFMNPILSEMEGNMDDVSYSYYHLIFWS